MLIEGYEAAITAEKIKKSTIVWMQTKEGGVHQAHKNLINFAKTVGSGHVVVVVVDSKWIIAYWNTGLVDTTTMPGPSQTQLDDIASLGVDVVYYKPTIITEEERVAKMLWASLEVRPYKWELLSRDKMNLCAILLCMMLPESIARNFDYIVGGPGVDHFFLIDYYKDKGYKRYPNMRVLYPIVEKDPLTGLRYQSSIENLGPKEIDKVREIKDILDKERKRFEKGQNTTLVQELNETYNNDTWRFQNIILHIGGIFKGWQLERVGIEVTTEQGVSVQLEDMTLTKDEMKEEQIVEEKIADQIDV